MKPTAAVYITCFGLAIACVAVLAIGLPRRHVQYVFEWQVPPAPGPDCFPDTSPSVLQADALTGGVFRGQLAASDSELGPLIHRWYATRPSKLLYIVLPNDATWQRAIDVGTLARRARAYVFVLGPPTGCLPLMHM